MSNFLEFLLLEDVHLNFDVMLMPQFNFSFQRSCDFFQIGIMQKLHPVSFPDKKTVASATGLVNEMRPSIVSHAVSPYLCTLLDKSEYTFLVNGIANLDFGADKHASVNLV